MANLALTVERKAFSVAIDAALKSLNKDREKGLLQEYGNLSFHSGLSATIPS